jgi:Domain of unknown function (DUF4124)
MALPSRLVFGGLLIATASAMAQSVAPTMYSCINAQGRRIISDRPLDECLGQLQNEIGRSGVVKRQNLAGVHQSSAPKEAAPPPNPVEPALDKSIREQRKQKALLERYANEASHTEERRRSQFNLTTSIAQAQQDISDQVNLSTRLTQEANVAKAKSPVLPLKLRQQIDQNNQTLELLRRVLVDRQQELALSNQRFDEELVLLRVLWAQPSTGKP